MKTDIKEAKGRGEEKERQQREQLAAMERRLEVRKNIKSYELWASHFPWHRKKYP